MIIRSTIISILIIIFIITIIFLLYKHFHKKIDLNFQKIFYLNHKIFSRGKTVKSCPKGCFGKKCKYASKCYNCLNKNPNCCCYDLQCKDC